MAWSPINLTVPQYVDSNGTPYSGAVLKAYAAGTSTPISMATDSTGGTTVGSVALNASGYPAVSGNVIIPHVLVNYKLTLYPTQAAADANSGALWTIDNLSPIASATGLAASGGSALVGFIQAGTGAVARTAQAKMREYVTPEDFGAAGTGLVDDTDAVQAALTAHKRVKMTGTYLIDTPLVPQADACLYGRGLVKATTAINLFEPDSKSNITFDIQFQGLSNDGAGNNLYAVYCKDTTAPCSNIRLIDPVATEILLFSNYSPDLHGNTAAFETYYAIAANKPKNIRIINPVCTCTTAVAASQRGCIMLAFPEDWSVVNPTITGHWYAIQTYAGSTSPIDATYDDRICKRGTISDPKIKGPDATGVSETAAIIILSADTVTINGGTIEDIGKETLDAENSRNITYNGQVLKNCKEALYVNGVNSDIRFCNIRGTLMDHADSKAMVSVSPAAPDLAAKLAKCGPITLDGVEIDAVGTGANAGLAVLQTPVTNVLTISRSDFLNVRLDQSNKNNITVIDEATKFRWSCDPVADAGGYRWMVKLGRMSTDFSPQSAPPKAAFHGKLLNVSSAAFANTVYGFYFVTNDIGTVPDPVQIEVSRAYVDATKAFLFGDNSTLERAFQIVDNTLNTTAVFDIVAAATCTGDKLYWRGNRDKFGQGIFGSFARVTDVGDGFALANIPTPVQGSCEPNNSADTGVTQGWVVDGAENWNPMANVA